MKNNIYLKLGKDWLLNCPIEGRKSFRMTVVIKKNVNEKILRKAALDLSARLPKFSVRIKRGIIRDYFIYAEEKDVVEKDVDKFKKQIIIYPLAFPGTDLQWQKILSVIHCLQEIRIYIIL